MTRETLPTRRQRTAVSFEHGGHAFIGGAGHYPDGRVGEVFLSSGKTGTHLQIATSDAAIAASLALQHGCHIETLRRAFLRNDDGSAAGPLGCLFDTLAGAGS